jgi:hypothetical protein
MFRTLLSLCIDIQCSDIQGFSYSCVVCCCWQINHASRDAIACLNEVYCMSTAVKSNSVVNYTGIWLLKHRLNSRLLLEASLTYLTAITLPNLLCSCSVREHRSTAITRLASPGIEFRRGSHIFLDIFRTFSVANTRIEPYEGYDFIPSRPPLIFLHIIFK